MKRTVLTHPVLAAALAAAILVSPLSAAAEDGVDLHPKFVHDQETYYKCLVITDHKITPPPPAEGAPAMPAQEMKVTMEMGYRFHTGEVKPDTAAQVEWTLLYVTLAFEPPMMPKFDSRSSENPNPMLQSAFASVLNKPATVMLSPDREISGIAGLEANQAGGQIQQMLDQLFSEKSLRQLPVLATAKAPRPASSGATWSDHFEVDLPQGMGTLMTDLKYTLDKVNEGGKQAELGVQGMTTSKAPPPPADSTEPPPPPMVQVKEGASTGHILWDLVKGEPIESTSNTKLAIDVHSPTGTVGMEQTVDVKLTRATQAEMGLDAAPAPKEGDHEEPKPATPPAIGDKPS